MNFVEEADRGIRVKIYVKPLSRKESLEYTGDELIFYTREKPVRGRANISLINFLSKTLNIPHENIKIVSGLKSRYKTLFIQGVSKDDFMRRIR